MEEEQQFDTALFRKRSPMYQCTPKKLGHFREVIGNHLRARKKLLCRQRIAQWSESRLNKQRVRHLMHWRWWEHLRLEGEEAHSALRRSGESGQSQDPSRRRAIRPFSVKIRAFKFCNRESSNQTKVAGSNSFDIKIWQTKFFLRFEIDIGASYPNLF